MFIAIPVWTPFWLRISVFAGIEKLHGRHGCTKVSVCPFEIEPKLRLSQHTTVQILQNRFHQRSDWMTTNRLNSRTRIFSGQPFRPQPEVPSLIEHPPITAIDPGAATVADVLSPQEDSPQDAPPPPAPLPLPAEPTAIAGCADLVYLSDLQLQSVQWLWQDRLASGTLAMSQCGDSIPHAGLRPQFSTKVMTLVQ